MQPVTSLSLRLSALSAAVFLVLGIYLPFFPVFLSSRGFDAPTVGVLLAVPVFVRVVATPLVASLADSRVSPPTLLVATHLGLGITYLAMLFADGFWSFVALNALAGVLHAGTVPLQDIVLMREIARDRQLHYGRLRAWGSVSFMAGNVLGGIAVARYSPDAVVVALALACFAAMAISTAQPSRFDAPGPDNPGESTGSGSLVSATTVLLIAGIALSHASHAGLNGFGTLNWQRLGYSVDLIGVLWALSFIAEMIVFWQIGALATRFDRALAMLAIGAAIGMLRWIAMALEPGVLASAFLQTWHAVSFGFVHLAGIAAIAMIAPAGRRSTTMGVAAGTGAFLSGLAMLASGRLYAASPAIMFAAMAGIAGVSLACYALIWLSRRG